MPSAAPRPCRYPGCGALVRDGSGYCAAHQAAAKKRSNFSKTLSRHERGYGWEWEKLRKVVLARDCGLCQPCKEADRITLGNIVDHIIAKAEGGTDELDNLQVICKPCHVQKTAREAARGGGRVSVEPSWLPESTVPVVVVCGPPGCGKSTYVQKLAATTDLVLDLDVIAANLFGQPLYYATKEQGLAAIRYRNKMLASLADKECGYQKVWLIVTAGTPDRREFWRRKYGDLVIMDTPKHECIQRVNRDERRTSEAKRDARVVIDQWW